MKKHLHQMYTFLVILFFIALSVFSEIKAQTTLTYSYTGGVQGFTVPSCVTTLTITAKGAAGGAGGYTGGGGGAVRGVITVTAGQVYNLYVGGQGSVTLGGYNGGGDGGSSSASNGGGGGGGTDIRFGGNALSNRIMAAAGGGGTGGSTSYVPAAGSGGGGAACTSPYGVGGGAAGGCAAGTAGGCTGGTATGYGTGGGGGGLTSGGATAGSGPGGLGNAGVLGVGGTGGSYTVATICNGGGGGGGGYYGGAGGMSGSTGCNGGGGGGSSYVDNNLFSSITFTAGSETAHGSIVIQFIPIGTSVTAVASPTSICNGNSASLTASNVVTYTWLPSGSFAGSNSNAVSVNPNSTTSFTVLGTNSNACVSQLVLTVTVSPAAPTLSISASTNSICLGKTATLTASGALTYTWTGGVTNGVSFAPSTTTTYTVSGQNGCGITTAVTTITVSALPVTTLASSTLICAGSPATLIAASSATGYTWQPFGISGQSIVVSPTVNTIYTITASDGTCAGTSTVALNTKPIPTLNLVYSNSVVCSGAPVTMTIGGATNYTWYPSNTNGTVVTVTPTTATLYSVTGENTVNCTSLASQVVLVNPAPTMTVVSSKTMVCVGGSVSLSALGAGTYSWNTGAQTASLLQNPVTTTVYSVIGTNTNTQCSSTKTIHIIVFAPQITVSSPTIICTGSSANLTASGGNPGGYLWSNGLGFQTITVTPTVATTFTCSAPSTSNNLTCSSSATTQVLLNPLPNISIASSKTVQCHKDAGAVLTATGGSTYIWSTNAVTSTIVVNTSAAATIIYTVSGTDANGCVNTSSISVLVKTCTGINELKKTENGIMVYPNPSNGNFEIKAETDLTLKLMNEVGQQIETIQLNAHTNYSVKLTDLAAGVYFLVGQNDNGKVNQKLVVTK